MLDAFLEVAYEKEKQASLREEVVSELKKLPVEELKKIASGQVKLAYHDSSGGCWLDQFKGTPMYQQALALEEQSLELDIADQQKNMAERAERDATWQARDALCVKKRMLELELRKAEAGMTGVEEDDDDDEDEAKEAPAVAPAATKEAAVQELAAARGALIIEAMRKEAAAVKRAGALPPALKAAKIPKGADADKDGKKGEGKSAPPFMKKSAALVVSDAWGREMAKQAAFEKYAEACFEKMAEVGFDNLEEMEKEAILAAIKAGLPIAKTFLGRAGKVLGKTYQGAGGGLAGVGEAAKKIPGLAMQGGKKLIRGVKGLMPAAGAAAQDVAQAAS